MKQVLITSLALLMLATTACKVDAVEEEIRNRENQETNESLEIVPDEVVDEEEAVVLPDEEDQEIDELSFIPMTWDNKHRDATKWTQYTYDAIYDVGESLLDSRPTDIAKFCPNYDNLNDDGKAMFWIHLVSSMTRYESNFRPETSFQESFKDRHGDFVISRGLLQLSIESARGYKCNLRNAQDLHDPQRNLECTVKILKRWVDDDNVISKRLTNGQWRGGARYWSVLRHTGSNRVAKITSMTRANAVCGL